MKTRVFRCDFDITAEMLRIFFRILMKVCGFARPVRLHRHLFNL